MTFKAPGSRPSVAAPGHDTARPMISSEALCQAALRASWHRDHQVAQRRQAWRWMLFWSWKYGRAAAGAGVVSGLIWVAVVQGIHSAPVMRPATQTMPRTAAKMALQPAPNAAKTAPGEPASKQTPLILDTSLLRPVVPDTEDLDTNTPTSASPAGGHPLQLKTEPWLSSKTAAHASLPASSSSPSFLKDLSP